MCLAVIQVIPRKWEGYGLLGTAAASCRNTSAFKLHSSLWFSGMHIRYDSYENARDNVLHVTVGCLP